MSYIPNPTDPTQPEDEVDASTAAAEFRALKAYVLSIVAPSAILKNPRRQTVLQGSVDANGQANYLTAGAGLNFNIDGTSTPIIFSFAGGFDVNGAVDNNSILVSALANQGALAASNINYLHATYVDQSNVTFDSTLLRPQYGAIFQQNRNALLQMDNSLIDGYGNTWTAPNGVSYVTGGIQKFGTHCAQLDGTNQYLNSASFTALPDGSWEISGWFNWNALPTAGLTDALFSFTNVAGFGVQLSLNDTAGTKKLQLNVSSNGTTNNVASAVLGTTTAWSTGVWYKVRVVFDSVAGTYRVYLSNNGAAETQEISVASALRVCPITVARIGANHTPTNYFNGYVDCVHFSACARATTTVIPAVAADTVDGHWFDTVNWVMKSASGPSTVAGNNPVFTEVNRVFFGEATTGAITVSSIVAYALNGHYDSGFFQVNALNTAYVKNHNIGTVALRIETLFSEFSDGTGWVLNGQRGNVFSTAGQYQGTPVVAADSKTLTLRSGSTNILGSFLDASGVATTPTSTWARVVVERNF